MKKNTWKERLYIPDTPELKAVRDWRVGIQSAKDKINALIAVRMELESKVTAAWTIALNDPTEENFAAWSALKEKFEARQRAENFLMQSRGHLNDKYEGHNSGAEDVLLPAIRVIRERLAKEIKALNDEEAKRLSDAGLDPVESPAIAPLKAHFADLVDAIMCIPEWVGAQSVWTRFQHLVK